MICGRWALHDVMKPEVLCVFEKRNRAAVFMTFRSLPPQTYTSVPSQNKASRSHVLYPKRVNSNAQCMRCPICLHTSLHEQPVWNFNDNPHPLCLAQWSTVQHVRVTHSAPEARWRPPDSIEKASLWLVVPQLRRIAYRK